MHGRSRILGFFWFLQAPLVLRICRRSATNGAFLCAEVTRWHLS